MVPPKGKGKEGDEGGSEAKKKLLIKRVEEKCWSKGRGKGVKRSRKVRESNKGDERATLSDGR